MPKIQTFGHLPIAFLNKPAETDVPQPPGNHTGAHIQITHLTSMLVHWYTPNPHRLPTLTCTRELHHLQHSTEEHSPPPPTTHRCTRAPKARSLLLCPRGGSLHFSAGNPGCRPQREQRPGGWEGGGLGPWPRPPLAFLFSLRSTATASSGSDCRVNHCDDLNNYRLPKREKKTRGINKQRRERPPGFLEPGRGDYIGAGVSGPLQSLRAFLGLGAGVGGVGLGAESFRGGSS